jgi:hypothetical protein
LRCVHAGNFFKLNLGTATDERKFGGEFLFLQVLAYRILVLWFGIFVLLFFLQFGNVFVFKNASTNFSSLRKYLPARFDPRRMSCISYGRALCNHSHLY